MKVLRKISRPALLLDSGKCRANIRNMAEKATLLKLHFRPHFKTHQSAAVGEWFREEGIKSITVSSVAMAEYFARCGWNDISIAFPVNLREVESINQLAKNIRLNLLLDSCEVAEQLQKELKAGVGIYIEVDTGSKRSGIPSANLTAFEILVEKLQKLSNLHFKGFLTHAGHIYRAQNRQEVLQIHHQSKEQMLRLKNHFSSCSPVISIGDTPSCSIAGDFEGVDEIRPGNFVFFDLTQAGIGSCTPENIALALACPVVANYPSRKEIILYGGAIHLSKDSLKNSNGEATYGRLALPDENGWQILPDENSVISLSQEHGIARVHDKRLAKVTPGDLIAVIPVHSCLTAHQMKEYLNSEGVIMKLMQ